MQGGGTGAFASVALNLMHKGGKADYILTGRKLFFFSCFYFIYLFFLLTVTLSLGIGVWSTKAAKEASKYLKVNHVFPKPEKFDGIPDQSTWSLDPEAAYVYYCDNETVNGKNNKLDLFNDDVTIRNLFALIIFVGMY